MFGNPKLDSVFLGGPRGARVAWERPFRDELLSVERLDERARALAARFTIDPSRRPARSVFPRFDDNDRVLREAYRTLADDVRRGDFVTAAAEWILDNYHLVAAEIRDVRQNLPRGYFRELPKLAGREQAGTARVYVLAVELIRHSDSRLDRAQLVRWLDAFQAVAPLTIGELWAWPSMLKLALVENLRRLADEILAAHSARRAADAYVARIDAAGKGRRRRCRASCTRRWWCSSSSACASTDLAWRRSGAASTRTSRRARSPPTRRSGPSTSARRPPRSRSPTSSPACGSAPRSTGPSTSRP